MELAVAVVLQALCVFLLRQQLGSRWLLRPFSLLILTAILYHGVSEAILLFSATARAEDTYRDSISQADLRLGVVFISGGMFFSTISYLVVLGSSRRKLPDSSDVRAAMRPLDWRLLVIVLIPLAGLTYGGRGYASGQVLDSQTQSQGEILAASLFVVVFVLTTFAFVYRHGRATFVPALGVQSVLMAAAGQRLEILIAAIVVCVLLSLVGITPTRKQIGVSLLIGGLLVSSITTVRTSTGREAFTGDTGINQRVSAVTSALLSDSDEPTGSTGLLSQASERFDSNEWAGGIISGLRKQPPMGLGALLQSMQIAIPSVIDPGKLAGDEFSRSSEAAQVNYFQLSPYDHLPGHFGLWLGLTGLWFYFPVMMGFGALFALAEKRMMSQITAARLVWISLLALSVLFYERGIPDMLTLLRFGIPLGLAASFAERALPRRDRKRTATIVRNARKA